MAERNGNTVLLYEAGTPDVLIGKLVNLERSEEVEVIDVTSKDDSGVRNILPGIYSSSITATLIYDDADSGQDSMRSALRAKTQVSMEIYQDASSFETVNGYVTSIGEVYPKDDVATTTITIEIDGSWS